MKTNFRNTKKARIEMLPMIDCVFLLLVFFIYAMLSMAVHRGLPVNLPASKTVKIDKKLVLAVTINADGSIFVDKEPVELDRLTTVLQAKADGARSAGGFALCRSQSHLSEPVRSSGSNSASRTEPYFAAGGAG